MLSRLPGGKLRIVIAAFVLIVFGNFLLTGCRMMCGGPSALGPSGGAWMHRSLDSGVGGDGQTFYYIDRDSSYTR